MKLLICTLVMFTSITSQACLGEAQITAVISGYTKTLSSCVVQISPSTVSFYSENKTCPLSLGEITNPGIEVGLASGHDCRFEIDDTLSGIVVKNVAGVISLE